MERERKRAPNFSLQEKTLLLNIIHKFKDIIENKKTNSQSWRDKDNTWHKITDMFNSQTPETFPRTKEALRKFYDNIKKNVRKEVADEKKEIFRTGGGVNQCSPNPIKDLALGLMNPKTVKGLQNEFDSDALENTDYNASDNYSNIELEEENPDTELEVNTLDHNYFEDPHPTQVTEPLDEQSSLFASPVLLLDNLNTEKRTSENNTLEPSKAKETKRAVPVHVKRPKSECLKSTWLKRRRPAIQQLPSSKLSEQYLHLSQIKIECFQAEKENMMARERRELELFELQKRKLSIEIKIEEEKLKELKNKNK